MPLASMGGSGVQIAQGRPHRQPRRDRRRRRRHRRPARGPGCRHRRLGSRGVLDPERRRRSARARSPIAACGASGWSSPTTARVCRRAPPGASSAPAGLQRCRVHWARKRPHRRNPCRPSSRGARLGFPPEHGLASSGGRPDALDPPQLSHHPPPCAPRSPVLPSAPASWPALLAPAPRPSARGASAGPRIDCLDHAARPRKLPWAAREEERALICALRPSLRRAVDRRAIHPSAQRDYRPLRRDRWARLEELRTGDGRRLPSRLRRDVERELRRLELVLEQLDVVEAERDKAVERPAPGDEDAAKVALLAKLAASAPSWRPC